MAEDSQLQVNSDLPPIAQPEPVSRQSGSESDKPRPSSRQQHATSTSAEELKSKHMLEHSHQHLGVTNKRREPLGERKEMDGKGIFLSSSTKEAQKMISPFLTEHIPQSYNPRGAATTTSSANPSSRKYCYRHRPDVKCRRTANEPTMEGLQKSLGQLSQTDQQGVSTVWSLFSAAPAKQRNLMLQGILAQCCYPQLSLIANQIRDLIKIDFLDALPPELSFKILLHLDTTSLCKASQVSQKWQRLADDDVVWHKMCEQHIDRKCTKCGWGLPLLEKKRLRAEQRLIQLRRSNFNAHDSSQHDAYALSTEAMFHAHDQEHHAATTSDTLSGSATDSNAPMIRTQSDQSGTSSSAPRKRSLEDVECSEQPKKRRWKEVYKDRFKVGTNWKYGRCQLRTLKGHTAGVYCLQLVDNILATGSYDNTAKIWNIETGEIIQTLKGHTNGIRCLQFDESRLFTGSLDGTVKVWNWRTGELVRTFAGHTSGVISLHFSQNILVSGSMDHTIKVWDLGTKVKYSLTGHSDWVNSVKLDSCSRTLFSASDDCTARLWDLDTRQCVRIFKGHVGQVQQVLPLPREFEMNEQEDPELHNSDHERTDNETSTRRPERRSDSPLFNSDRPSPPNYMLTGSLDSTIRLWHVASARCVRTFFGHLEGVWALAADTLRMVSGAEDRCVKVWDPRTGEHQRTITGHAGPVTCVALSDSRLVTGSEDHSVMIYNFEGGSDALGEGDDPSERRLVCRGTPG